MSTTGYLAINPSALNVPPARDDAGIVQYMQDVKQILSELNHNLSLAIDTVNVHTTSLATIDTTLQNHDTSITQQDTSIINLLSQIQTITAAVGTNPLSSLSTGRKVKLAMPTKFDGTDKSKAVSFRVSVMHYLRVGYPGTSVEEAIAFIISCLDGKAYDWLDPYREQDFVHGQPVTWLHDIDAFWEQFNLHWNVQNKTEDYRVKFRALKQGSKSAQEYYKDFQTYSQSLGYNGTALWDFFYDSLSVKIKEMLMAQDFDHSDASVTLEVLAAKTLKIDQQLSEFEAMNKGSSGSTSGTKSGATSSTAAQGGPRDKLSVGDAVYMIGTDGKAKKGTIKKIDRNDKGAATPTVKWKDGTTSTATFKQIKKDNMPDIVVAPNPSTKPSKPSDAMDLDAAGKGKKPVVCNTCGGKGHYANQCPSKPFSGQGTSISDDEESEKGDL
jgi:hypothetical protein